MLTIQPIGVSMNVPRNQTSTPIIMSASITAQHQAISLTPMEESVSLAAATSRELLDTYNTETHELVGANKTALSTHGEIIQPICVLSSALLNLLPTTRQANASLSAQNLKVYMLTCCCMCAPQLALEVTSEAKSIKHASKFAMMGTMEIQQPLFALCYVLSKFIATDKMSQEPA